MATADTKRQRHVISDEELGRLIALIKGADSVELKATVPAADQRSAVDALGLDPLEAQIRQVFFFDTPDLALDASGLVVRARRVQGGSGDSVVKLRPVEPDGLSKRTRRSPSFGVEVDAMPGGFVCSGSMKGVGDAASVRDAVGGGRPIRKLFSKEQRAFYERARPRRGRAGRSGDPRADLRAEAEVHAEGLRPEADGGDVAVSRTTPGSSSSRRSASRARRSQVAAETRAFLGAKGIDLDAEQQTKTRTALELFSKSAR